MSLSLGAEPSGDSTTGGRAGRCSIRRQADGAVVVPRAKWCASFLCRLRGLTFRRRLNPDEALILVEASESRLGTAIHMVFVFFPIAAIWLDSQGMVVDARLAHPFVSVCVPRRPARYVLEGVPALLDHIHSGDRLEFVPIR